MHAGRDATFIVNILGNSDTSSIVNKVEAKISDDNSLLEELKALYASRKMLQRIFYSSPLPVESLFVSLSIVKREEQKQKEAKMEIEAIAAGSTSERPKAINPEQALYVNTYERIYASKAPILLEAIFTPDKEDKLPRRVLLLGSAGIGKTTLCQYITYQWSKGELWAGDASENGFHWVFHIPLRRLLSSHYQEGQRLRAEFIGQDANLLLAKIIHHEVYEDSASLSVEAIRAILEAGRAENPRQRVLLLLDGWDEVSEHYHNPQSPYQDILKKIIAYPDILMTSRPAEVFGLDIDRQIESIGFSDEQIHLYLEKFFHTLNPSELKEKAPEESITSLKHFLKQNPNVKGMAHIPLQLEMIASLWNDRSKEQSLTTPISLSQLLGEMCTKLWRRYQKRGKDTGKATYSETDLLKPLSQLAYEHFILDSRQLLIPTDQMKRFHEEFSAHYNDILALGILKATKESEFIEDNDYYFIHLTFQEYLAALYWVRLFCSESMHEKEQAEEFLRRNKYELRYELFWGFAAGLLKKQVESRPLFVTRLNAFFKILEEDPQDLIGARHMAVLTRCLGECECHEALFNRKRLLKSIEEWFSQQATRHINEGYLQIVLSYSNVVVNAVQIAWLKHAELALSQENYQDIEYWLHFLGEYLPDNTRVGELWLSLASHEPCLSRNSHELKKLMPNIKLNEAQWKKAIISLASSIQSTDVDVIDGAAKILQSLCSLLTTEIQFLLISQLMAYMHSKDFGVRNGAARILPSLYTSIAPETQALFISQLMVCMQSEDSKIRISAAAILQSFYFLLTPEMRALFINQLMFCMQSEDPYVRYSAAEILQSLYSLLTPETLALFMNQLMLCMQSEGATIRISAARILQSFYSLLTPETQVLFMSQLMLCMKSDEFWVRISAAEILQSLYSLLTPETQTQLINQLILYMQSQDFGVRISAAQMLQSFYSLLTPERQALFISQLMPCVQSKDSWVRASAAKILESLYSLLPQETQAQFISQLMPCMQSKDSLIRVSTTEILESLYSLLTPETQTQLINQLILYMQSEDVEIRDDAAKILQPLYFLLPQEAQAQLISQLMLCMQSKESWVRASAAKILQPLYSLLTPETQALFMSQLMPCIQSGNSWVRASTAKILQSFYHLLTSETQAQLINQLMLCMQSQDVEVRDDAAKILQPLYSLLPQETKAQLINQLMLCMQSQDFGVRISAAEILQSFYSLLMPERQTLFMNQLMFCMQSEDPKIRISVAEILQSLYSLLPQETQAQLISQLMPCMQSKDFWVRASAAKILQSLYSLLTPETQAQLISQLMLCMQSQDFEVRINTAQMLQSFYSLLTPERQVLFISQLMPCVQSKDFWVRASAAKILQSLYSLLPQETQAQLISQLMSCMQSQDFEVRINAEKILQSHYSLLTPETQALFIGQLMPFLQSEDFGERIRAEKILQPFCFLFKMGQIRKIFDCILAVSEKSDELIGLIQYLDLTDYIKNYPDSVKEVIRLIHNSNSYLRDRVLTNLCSRYLITTTAEEKQKLQMNQSFCR